MSWMFYVADPNPVLMCQLCGVGFNSPKQAQSHYSGQKHKMRVELNFGPVPVPITVHHLDHDVTKHYSNDYLHQNSRTFASYCNLLVA